MSAETTTRPGWVVRLSLITTAFAYGVICAGGNVKSKEAGLAVPDWPLSYGLPSPWVIVALGALVVVSGLWLARAYKTKNVQWGAPVLLAASAAILFWYLFQSPERWIQIDNLRAEHGHRLLAGGLGVLLIALAFAVFKHEPRRAVRRLMIAAFVGYLAQAALGGLTVIIFLKASVYHAFLAQAEFGILVALTLMMSRSWETSGAAEESGVLAPATTALIYVQIILGALVRHTDKAALSIPSFPLPLFPEAFSTPVTLQVIHRLGAVAVCVMVFAVLVHALRHHRSELRIVKPALAMALMAVLQVTLGGLIIWTGRVDFVATAHVAVGSLLVATSLVVTLQSRRSAVRVESVKQV